MSEQKVSEEKQANKTSDKKCNLKCKTCEHYNRVGDFCREKGIKHCSQQVNTDFSVCDTYLVRENLIMF